MDKPAVLFTPEQIAARIRQIGSEVGRDFDGKEICVVGLIKSCMVFMADLVRAIPLDMTCHFLRVSSLREGSAGAARTDIVYTTEIAYEDRHILLLDDIIDTGITLNFLLDHIRERRPRSLKVAALIDKPADRKIEVQVDWAAFTLKEPAGERFLVGYGLDYGERYRGLPYIGTIPRPDKPGEGRTISIASGI
jgi:hypoxanthine phosphoribosyltransferase